jgi:hypothetical protein
VKNIITALVISAFVIIGILLSLIAIYAAPDEHVHFTEAGYFWLGDAIALFGLLNYFKKHKV